VHLSRLRDYVRRRDAAGLPGGAAAIATAIALALPVLAAAVPAAAQFQTPLEAIQAHKSGAEWAERFDATLPEVRQVKSSVPTVTEATPGAIEIAIQRYSAIATRGGWPVVPASGEPLRLGDRDPAVTVLRERLAMSGDLRQARGQPEVFDSYVDAAVRRFQLRHGLMADGVVDAKTLAAMNVPVWVRLRQLETNLGRVAELARKLGDRYVLVNIPAAEIEAVDEGRVRSRHTAVVGKIDRQTPIVSSRIHELNFNPYWTVPVSIIRKDLIPKMQEDPEYLSRNKIRIYRWGSEEELLPSDIDWYSDEATQYMFRQDPGELNSLGSVRINFHNPHSVYLHDTPSKNLFGSDFRFHSSGCVRVQNVRELITWLLGPNGWTRAEVDAMFRNGERLDVKLERPVPIHMAYVTAWATADGVVHFRDDIYQKDGVGRLASAEGGPETR
jgi:murein L,D-transpeptidase YcbB/YkuD